MSEVLTEKIAEHLDVDPASVASELSDYLSDLSARVRGGMVHRIPGFGTFEPVNGTVRFTPSPELASAVNFRYEGLTEIELSDAPPAVSPDVIPDKVSDLIPDNVSDVVSDIASDTASDIAESEKSVSVVPTTPETVPIDEHEDGSPERTHAPGPRHEPSEVSTTGMSRASSSRPSSSRSSLSRSSLSRSWRIGLPVTILLVVVAALFIFDMLPGGQTPSANDTQQPGPPSSELESGQVPADNGINTGDADASVAEDDSAPDELESEEGDLAQDEPVASTSPPAEDAPAAANQPTARESNDPSRFESEFDGETPGYTLVVSSFDTEQDAITEAERYASLGLPRAVLVYVDNGITYYRVAVGQFDTSDAAVEEKARLGNRIPGDAWPRRIGLATNQ